MNYQVIVTREADVDAVDILHWLSEDYSFESAERWYSKYLEALVSLETFPARCPIAYEREDEDEEVRQLLFEQYRILFAIEGNTVRVVHVKHQKQRPRSPNR